MVSFSSNTLEIERLYWRVCSGAMSSLPAPQLKIALLLIANDSKMVGGVGLLFESTETFNSTDTKELSLSPTSVVPEAIISGFLSWLISTKEIVLAPSIV